MRHFLSLCGQAWVIVLLADFTAGIVHWIMDAYITDDVPVLGPLLSRTNTLHHHHPRACVRVSFWSTTWESLLIAAAIVGVAFACGGPGWRTWLFATAVASASLVHRWSHRTRRENGPVIAWLQDCGLIQHP